MFPAPRMPVYHLLQHLFHSLTPTSSPTPLVTAPRSVLPFGLVYIVFSSSVDDVTASSAVVQQPESASNVPMVSLTPTPTAITTTTYSSSSELLLESSDETWPLFDNNDLIGCSFDILVVPSCLEMLDVVDEHNYALQKVLPEDSPSNVFVAVC